MRHRAGLIACDSAPRSLWPARVPRKVRESLQNRVKKPIPAATADMVSTACRQTVAGTTWTIPAGSARGAAEFPLMEIPACRRRLETVRNGGTRNPVRTRPDSRDRNGWNSGRRASQTGRKTVSFQGFKPLHGFNRNCHALAGR
ncbi:unnamed protein product [Acidocella sp. C78]|nr:unnamed protein product [Acidocella sp. C78]